MKTSIALIGFMGTGKTVVGKALAGKLGRKFIELDSLIEERAGKSIAEIFQRDGEMAFRELEIEVARNVADSKNQVIACGGGIVLNKINIDRLKKESLIVYLTASPKAILKRVSDDDEERPLLKATDLAQAIQGLLQFRKPYYERAADIKIDTSKLDVNSVVERIINKVKQVENFSL